MRLRACHDRVPGIGAGLGLQGFDETCIVRAGDPAGVIRCSDNSSSSDCTRSLTVLMVAVPRSQLTWLRATAR